MKPWDGRRVLVTGATGVVGSWLVKSLLERNAEITCFIFDEDPQSEVIRSGDLRRVQRIDGDLRDASTVKKAVATEPEIIFHLGAQTQVGAALSDPLETLETNVRGTWNLLEACRVNPGRIQSIVIASSDKAYGESKTLPYIEEAALHGRHPYDVSKSCTDLVAQSYFHTFRLPVTISRCGNIYGGGDLNWNRIVPGTIRSLLKKERPVIRSDGRFIRDYLYVKDAVSGYLRLAERAAPGEAFNFSREEKKTVLQIVETIQKLMKCTAVKPDIKNTASAEIRDQWLSAAKARKKLGWKPQYTLEKGLKETIDWYRKLLA